MGEWQEFLDPHLAQQIQRWVCDALEHTRQSRDCFPTLGSHNAQCTMHNAWGPGWRRCACRTCAAMRHSVWLGWGSGMNCHSPSRLCSTSITTSRPQQARASDETSLALNLIIFNSKLCSKIKAQNAKQARKVSHQAERVWCYDRRVSVREREHSGTAAT